MQGTSGIEGNMGRALWLDDCTAASGGATDVFLYLFVRTFEITLELISKVSTKSPGEKCTSKAPGRARTYQRSRDTVHR